MEPTEQPEHQQPNHEAFEKWRKHRQEQGPLLDPFFMESLPEELVLLAGHDDFSEFGSLVYLEQATCYVPADPRFEVELSVFTREALKVRRVPMETARAFEVLVGVDTSLRRNVEAEELRVLDDPSTAMDFVQRELVHHPFSGGKVVSTTEILKLMEPERQRGTLLHRRQHVIDEEPERVVAISKAIYYLREGHTPSGIGAWFEQPFTELGGRSALDKLNHPHQPFAVEAVEIIELARAGRGQIAT